MRWQLPTFNVDILLQLNFSVLLDTPEDVSRAILRPTKLIMLVSHYIEYLSELWQQPKRLKMWPRWGGPCVCPGESGDLLSFPH